MKRNSSSGEGPSGRLSAAALAALLFCAFAASGEDIPAAGPSAEGSLPDMPFLLLQIQADVQGSLNGLEAAVADASAELSATGLEGDAARQVLRRLLEANPDLVEAVTFDIEGRIVVAECDDCEGAEGAQGADIGGQEHISHVLNTRNPAFSGEFLLVEGYMGTAIAYPVFSEDGGLLGGISAILEPEDLMDRLVAPHLGYDVTTRSQIIDYSFWAMDPDGLILYDRDEGQIGKLLFEDPLYQPFPSLLDLGERIAAERAGHGYYSFQVAEGDETVVTKESYWTTAGLHGRDWRLVLTRIAE